MRLPRNIPWTAPPYLLRHLKNVALLTPCVRNRSGTGTPLSASRRMPTIWVSLNLDFRMTAPWTRAVYVQLSIDRGSLRQDLGGRYLADRDKERVKQRLLQRLQDLGIVVEVKAA